MNAHQKYSGSCQCGAVTFDVALDLSSTAVCNCSRCVRLGWIMSFTPATSFDLQSGADRLNQYTFNREVIHHQFCRVCGIEPFARAKGPDGREMVAVNVRCLEGVDVDSLTPRKVDGKSR